MKEHWRETVVREALRWWERRIVDGTPRGNAIIGMEIFPAGKNPPMHDYQNGALAWCGRFAEACYHAAGFLGGALDSAGKAIYGYGLGNRTFTGAKAFDAYLGREDKGRVVHQDFAAARPGDLLVKLKPGTYNGHVMLVERVGEGCVHTIEGNAHGMLPREAPFQREMEHREGVVRNMHRIETLEEIKKTVPHYVIVPTDADFGQARVLHRRSPKPIATSILEVIETRPTAVFGKRKPVKKKPAKRTPKKK